MRIHDPAPKKKKLDEASKAKKDHNKGRILALEERIDTLTKSLHESRTRETELEEQVAVIFINIYIAILI